MATCWNGAVLTAWVGLLSALLAGCGDKKTPAPAPPQIPIRLVVPEATLATLVKIVGADQTARLESVVDERFFLRQARFEKCGEAMKRMVKAMANGAYEYAAEQQRHLNECACTLSTDAIGVVDRRRHLNNVWGALKGINVSTTTCRVEDSKDEPMRSRELWGMLVGDCGKETKPVEIASRNLRCTGLRKPFYFRFVNGTDGWRILSVDGPGWEEAGTRFLAQRRSSELNSYME